MKKLMKRKNPKKSLLALFIALTLAAASIAPGTALAVFAAPPGGESQSEADDVFDEDTAEADAVVDAASNRVADAATGSQDAATGSQGAATASQGAASGSQGAATASQGAASGSQDAGQADIRAVAAAITSEGSNLTKEQKAELLSDIGVMKGDPDRGLMLEIKVRRSDAAVFFTRLLGKEQTVIDGASTTYASTNFPDAPTGMWYTPYISYCVSIGLIAGRTDGKYYPDDNISEKEFANVLYKILGYVYDEDYTWDSVYEFGYDIGLFDEPSYATKTEDNREYFRRDVSNEVFTVLGLEKKDSSDKLLEELTANGAIGREAALAMGVKIGTLAAANAAAGGSQDGSSTGSGGDVVPGLDEYADIEDVYHLEDDVIWVVFTKPVTVKAENIEISETYDFSKTLVATVEDESPYDLVIRTSEQVPNMDYTIDISNVIEADGTNAGMLSYDFYGFDVNAPDDDWAGLTTRERDPEELAASRQAAGSGVPQAPSTSASSSGGTVNSASASGSGASGSGAAASGSGSGATGSAASASGSGSGGASGNADVSTEYFRIVNAYTVSSDQLVIYFSHPITDAALTASYYNLYSDGANVTSGTSRNVRVEAIENAVNAVRLTISGLTFVKGVNYSVTVSGNLVSAYMARLNDGYDDSYAFSAETVEPDVSAAFSVKSVSTPSQYAIDVVFTQPVNQDVARRQYVYYIEDQNAKRVDVKDVSVVSGAGAALGSGGGSGSGVRLSVAQPLNAQSSYSLTVVYMQNIDKNAEIKNAQYPFRYSLSGALSGVSASEIAITSVSAPDVGSVDLFFSVKPDVASALSISNYTVSWPASTGTPSGNASPIKASYDAALNPYGVKLYFASNVKFKRGVAYTMRVGMAFRDEGLSLPSKALDMQFYCDSDASPNPALTDASVVGENLVKLTFSKEISFDPQSLSEGNYVLEDLNGVKAEALPTMVKYVDPRTVVLKFDRSGTELGAEVASGARYRVRVGAIADLSGVYTSRYPDQGASFALRAGRR